MIFGTLTRDQKAELKDGMEKIATHYGIEIQQAKLCEECGEYITEVNKSNIACMMYRPEDSIGRHLDRQSEEFADMAVVWLEVFYLMHPERQKQVLDTMLMKVRRQLDRIEKGDRE
jgi:hypothetical protein